MTAKARKARASRVPENETAEEKFCRLALARMNRVLPAVANIGNLGTSQYAKTPEQIDAIETALRAAVDSAVARLRSVKSDKPTFSF
jgi:hypothetical protein